MFSRTCSYMQKQAVVRWRSTAVLSQLDTPPLQLKTKITERAERFIFNREHFVEREGIVS